jgi:hypothetical protein
MRTAETLVPDRGVTATFPVPHASYPESAVATRGAVADRPGPERQTQFRLATG